MGMVRFGIPQTLVLWARDTFGIRLFVETGTNRANTATWAADYFDWVVSIEGQKDLFDTNVRQHGHRTNLRFLHGDSRHQLKPVLDEIGGPAIIWLDAHWCGDGTFGVGAECPILDELSAVNCSHPDHIILIDDARYFTAPAPRPHRAEDWPGLIDIAAALACGSALRYAVIYDDVIVAIPASRRNVLDEYVRDEVEAQSRKPPRPLWWRAMRRMARMIK